MTIYTRACGLAAALTICAFAAPASATVMLVTYTGKVVVGGYDDGAGGLYKDTDDAALFGARGAHLGGADFTATFLYDTHLGVDSHTPVGPDDHTRVGGTSSGDGGVIPVLDATLKINGVTQHLGLGSKFGSIRVFNGLVAQFYQPSPPNLMGFRNTIAGVTELDQTFDTDLAGVVSAGANSFIMSFPPGAPTILNFSVTHATAIESAIPEPAAWALMLLGFGGIGSVVRRRRSVAAV